MREVIQLVRAASEVVGSVRRAFLGSGSHWRQTAVPCAASWPAVEKVDR